VLYKLTFCQLAKVGFGGLGRKKKMGCNPLGLGSKRIAIWVGVDKARCPLCAVKNIEEKLCSRHKIDSREKRNDQKERLWGEEVRL